MEAASIDDDPAPAVIESKTKFKLEPLRKKAAARPPKGHVAAKQKPAARQPRSVPALGLCSVFSCICVQPYIYFIRREYTR